MRLSQMQETVAEATVKWGEHTIAFGYHPAKVTPASLDAMLDQAEDEDVNVLSDALLPLLASWEITDDEDVPLPITADTLRTLPFALLASFMASIQEGMLPPDERASAGTSPRRGPSDKRRRGTG